MIWKGFRFGMILQFAIGPVFLLIFQSAVLSGFLSALSGVVGVALVDAFYIAAALFGIHSFIEKKKKWLQRFGSIVVIVFGLYTIIQAVPSDVVTEVKHHSVFLQAVILTLASPLTILFWIGVFSMKAAEEQLQKVDLLLFGSGAVVSTLVFLTTIAVIGTMIQSLLTDVLYTILNICVGLLLVAFGIRNLLKHDKDNSVSV